MQSKSSTRVVSLSTFKNTTYNKLENNPYVAITIDGPITIVIHTFDG
jgi:hypothetical protein